jgi:predicted nucleic acid-binding protein
MMRVVLDASVVVKWLAPVLDDELDADKAVEILAAVESERLSLHQPPHWLAEVAAVVTRLNPDTAQQKVAALYAMDFPVLDTPEMYVFACKLAWELEHHVFDTLYHAVALELRETVLVTADERYYKKAKRHGCIALLSEFRL